MVSSEMSYYTDVGVLKDLEEGRAKQGPASVRLICQVLLRKLELLHHPSHSEGSLAPKK